MTPEPDPDQGRWYRPAFVHLETYDPRWAIAYEAERRTLVATLGRDLVAVEHVGSTAVPGMPAKPIIDIIAAVSSWSGLSELVERLASLGYRYTPESEADDPSRRVFRKGPDDFGLMRTHHLHVTLAGSDYWRRIVSFRDWLRAHPEDAAAYTRLKRDLVAVHANDSQGYTRGKAEFVRSVEGLAGVEEFDT